MPIALTNSSTERVEHIGFLDHSRQCLLRRPTRLEKRWEIAAFTQLRDLQVDRTGARLPQPLSIAVATVQALRISLAVTCCAQVLGVHFHHALGDVLDHLLQQIGIRTLLGKLSKCDIGLGGGHRGVLSKVRCGNQTLSRLTVAAASFEISGRSYTTIRDAIGR
jgi:hypothetical protein